MACKIYWNKSFEGEREDNNDNNNNNKSFIGYDWKSLQEVTKSQEVTKASGKKNLSCEMRKKRKEWVCRLTLCELVHASYLVQASQA